MMRSQDIAAAPGLRLYSEYLDAPAQSELLDAVAEILAEAPLYQPRLPGSGKAMSVKMTNCGPLGWMTDQTGGYRYVARHPETGRPWPPIPGAIMEVWRELSGYGALAEACLVNHYGPGARMGLHRDSDEAALDAPVLSISLGDTALFRVSGPRRKDPSRSLRLASGDVLLLAGEARHFYHGVDRTLFGSSRLLAAAGLPPGRINLTLRRVTRPE